MLNSSAPRRVPVWPWVRSYLEGNTKQLPGSTHSVYLLPFGELRRKCALLRNRPKPSPSPEELGHRLDLRSCVSARRTGRSLAQAPKNLSIDSNSDLFSSCPTARSKPSPGPEEPEHRLDLRPTAMFSGSVGYRCFSWWVGWGKAVSPAQALSLSQNGDTTLTHHQP